jgi:outer membrane protein OmpA-like peptidoglycan-associated protein
MSSSLLDSLTGLITPDLIGKAASYLGDPEGSVSKGIAAALPLVLGGVATKASDQGFANGLFDLVSNPANDGSVLNNVAALLTPSATSSPLGSLGGRLLSAVFGDNMNSAASALSGYAGSKPSTGNSLLSFVAPLVLGVLGKTVRSGGLNVSSLASLLLGQKDSIAGALPGPLANLDRFVSTPARVVSAPLPAEEPSRPSIWRWLLPILIALLAIWLLSKIFGRRETPVDETTPAPAAVEPAPQPAPVEPAATDTAPLAGAPSATLYFDVGSADLPADSTGGLEPVIAYLKANPSTAAVVSGYHDASGDAASNEELAKNRALAVQNALEGAGVDAGRIQLEKPAVATGAGSPDDARRVEVTVR